MNTTLRNSTLAKGAGAVGSAVGQGALGAGQTAAALGLLGVARTLGPGATKYLAPTKREANENDEFNDDLEVKESVEALQKATIELTAVSEKFAEKKKDIIPDFEL